MNILIADKLSDSAVTALEKLGAVIRFEPALTAEDLPESIKDAEVLIVRSTKVTKETIGRGGNLALIIRAGAGVNTIDLAEASARGIQVANCPGKNADAVAELAMGLIVAADRRIADCTMDLRQGTWNKKLYSKAAGLKDRTLAVIGLGSIGLGTARRAQAFGMNVVAWSRSLTPEKAETLGIGYCSSPVEAAGKADVLSVHLAASKDTAHFINETIFDAMKDGAIFVNTSRGEVVDTAALKEAVKQKGLKAALDVYENEPGASAREFADTELAGMITGTHHIGASTDQASEAIASEVVNVVAAYRDTGKALHQVNNQEKSPAPYKLIIRHYNKIGALAGVLDELRAANVNIEEMENSIFSGGKAAVCSLKLDQKPDSAVLDKIKAMDAVIQTTLK